jgi:DNA helicase-2/ATP-dependent DNA helicase PcrA
MFVESTGWDDGLDDAQLEAVTHGDGPLVVMAGAGTGKTRALVARMVCLLDRGVAPSRILLLTFTRRAADEMLARATRMAGCRGDERPQGGTFHAVAHRHVAAYRDVLGFPAGCGVLDAAGACDLMDLLRQDHGLTGTAERFPRSSTLVDVYSRCVNNERPLRELVRTLFPWCEPHVDNMALLFKQYTARKRSSGLVDFDDLLLGWRALLADAVLGPHLAERYSHVLVDEYQDVNSLQVDIVRMLRPEGRGLTVVGDEAQSIYGFRGSDPRHLRSMVEAYPDSTLVRLERNFRSRQAVLEVANALRPGDDAIRLHGDRAGGPRPRLVRAHDAPSEARAVVDRILEAHEGGTRLCDQAVLVRAGHQSDLIELELSARRVPYRKYGGLRFLEAAHVRDFVAAARIADNPSDEVAWYRLLRLHRNIGPSRARELIEVARTLDGDPLAHWPELVAAAPANARSDLSASLDKIHGTRGASGPGARAQGVAEAIGPLVEGRYSDARARLEDLDRLVGAASAVDDFSTWLADLTLDPPASTGDLAGDPHLDEDFVVISTIHSAKGLEWPVVHLPHLVDGAMPSDMALKDPGGLEEEHRLLYVAVTRARDELHLYAPLRMPHHRHGRDDRHSFAPVTRFVDDDVLATLEVVEEARPSLRVDGGHRGTVTVDLDPLWA